MSTATRRRAHLATPRSTRRGSLLRMPRAVWRVRVHWLALLGRRHMRRTARA